VITTPGWAAQQVADLLVQVGVTSLLNFAPRVLTVPAHVYLRYVDLSIELQVLGFYRARRGEAEPVAESEGDRLPAIRSVGLAAPTDLA
jgi:redox-sensing transcriptional repressor